MRRQSIGADSTDHQGDLTVESARDCCARRRAKGCQFSTPGRTPIAGIHEFATRPSCRPRLPATDFSSASHVQPR